MPWINMGGSTHAQVDLEEFQYGTPAQTRQRPRQVRALIQLRQSTGRSRSGATPMALCGSDRQADASIPNTEAGHLIGLELGGVDCPANLAPMFGNINRGVFRNLERGLREKAASSSKPAMHIEIVYGTGVGIDPRVPAGFRVRFFSGIDDLNTVGASPLVPPEAIPNQALAPARLDLTAFADIERRAKLIEIRDKVARTGWKIEDMDGPAAEWAKRGYMPPPSHRPYAFLDLLVYADEFKVCAHMLLPRWDAISIGPVREFAEGQRVNIAVANRYTQAGDKKGECWSDAAADPVTTALTELGTDDGIHVDHIHPMASGGPNIYSNAQVTSAKFNRSKGRS